MAYGIIDLQAWGVRVVDYVSALEDTMFGVLGEWGIEGRRHECARGAWVGERKVGSVGLHVRRFVSMHGAALNVAPNMEHIALMNPCGLEDTEMTSLSAEAGRAGGGGGGGGGVRAAVRAGAASTSARVEVGGSFETIPAARSLAGVVGLG